MPVCLQAIVDIFPSHAVSSREEIADLSAILHAILVAWSLSAAVVPVRYWKVCFRARRFYGHVLADLA